MKKRIAIIAVLVLVVLIITAIFYRNSKISKTNNGATITNTKIFSDDVSYLTKDSEVNIYRNKITKKANIEMKYKIKDQDETTELLGEKTTMVPFLVNTTCSMMTAGIFDPESLEKLSGEDTTTSKKDEQMDNYLKGYTPTDFKLIFVDAETNEKIASCESTQAGSGNIKFEVFRDYTTINSFFGSKIGVFTDK